MKTLNARKIKQKQNNKDAGGIMQAIQAVQMVALLTLRNQGWGAKRLQQFSEEFNNNINGISMGYVSLEDITNMLEAETGLTKDDLILKSWRRK